MKPTISRKTIPRKYNLVLIAINIRSRYNVGSIFRISDAVGVQKIYLCGITPAPPHPKINKVSLGAENAVPYEKCINAARIIKLLKKQGFNIISLELNKRAKNIFTMTFKRKTALIVGSEISGIAPNILKLSDEIAYIPMIGKKESLNVSVAFAVSSYAILQKTMKWS